MGTFPKIHTLADLVHEAIPFYDKPDCLMVKSGGAYRNISGKEVKKSIEALAAYLIDAGIKKGDRVGIFSENRAEWAYSDLAIICIGAISIPIYSTLPARQAEYIIRNSEMGLLFVSNESQLKKVVEIRNTVPHLKRVIVFDAPAELPPDTSTLADALQQGATVFENTASRLQERRQQMNPDDVFTIVYTSGTTGEPKGVMLTNRNMLSNVEAVRPAFQLRPGDLTLSFLPLSHVFERMAGYYLALHTGVTIAYAESLEMMPRNLIEVQPTVLMSVPRVYEKFHARIMDGIAAGTGTKKKLALWAFQTASRYTEMKLNGQSPPVTLSIKYGIADRLVFKKIRERLGGKLRLIVSGGAALPKQLAYFFYGIGLTILEGYGLTETSPVIAVNMPEAFKFGTVGQPIPGVEVKIAEDGEVLTRGPHVMKGYYNKPKETSEVISTDGWFHTGDIGEIDADGYLRITDRKKDLIVTSAGKNIAPQFVENTLKASPYVAQVVVIGDRRNFPSALIVPNLDRLKSFAATRQISESELYTHRDIIAEVQRDIDSLSRDLAPFERVKKIALISSEFTVESGELTPSLKVKRNVVEKKYRNVIDALYGEAHHG